VLASELRARAEEVERWRRAKERTRKHLGLDAVGRMLGLGEEVAPLDRWEAWSGVLLGTGEGWC
jgi:hypothetical protein